MEYSAGRTRLRFVIHCLASPMLRTLLVGLSLLLVCGGCDNVGRAFDPVLDPPNQEPTTGESPIQVVPVGGDARDGRPKVRSIVPEDGGWPLEVPIVIEFSESVNEASIEPTTPTGLDGRIALRVAGTPQVLPCLYDFVAGGKVLVMRPVTALSNEQSQTYEVVLFPDARDTDGVRFDVDGDEEILSSFQVNQSESFTDGRILATVPRNNKSDVERGADYFVIFDRPANVGSIDPLTNFVLSAGGAAVAGTADAPLESPVGADDGRVIRFDPAAPLDANARHEFEVDNTITFGATGTLDYSGRTPFAVFDTIGPQAALDVHLDNALTGYPEALNRLTLSSARLAVTPPVDAAAGDMVLARIYGLDALTSTVGDLAFIEASVTLALGWTVPVLVDFAGALGTPEDPLFEDGSISFAVQMRRGTQQSGFIQHDSAAEPRMDVTPPSLTRIGPPGSATGADIYTDLEHLAMYGTASEQLADAELTDGVNPATGMFASDENGFFTMEPVSLGRLSSPRPFTLTLTDLAGNLVEAPVSGQIVQRGHVTGTVAGTLVVEAYDHVTLAPIAGAVVLVDPGLPTLPATAQLVELTGSDGLATISGLTAVSHSVTILAPGYDLVSLLDTQAARVSLPLRPTGDPTAMFGGSAVLPPTFNDPLLVGHSALDDPLLLDIATTASAPTAIPSTAITPGRPQLVTAFSGTFEPTALPTFSLFAYDMLGGTLTSTLPPLEPAELGGSTQAALGLVPPVPGMTNDVVLSLDKDFQNAAGLDPLNLLGGAPIVRVTASLQGFGGQVLAGVGYASPTTATAYSVFGTYGMPILTGFAAFVPQLWVVTQARDSGGRVSRHRALWDAVTGALDVLEVPSIPVITPPAAPATGSPEIVFDDVLEVPLGLGGAGFAIAEIVAQDPQGRRWRLLYPDSDPSGATRTVQLPDLTAAGTPGPVSGDWAVRVDARIWFSLTGSSASEFVLSEVRRQELTYARSASLTVSVQ